LEMRRGQDSNRRVQGSSLGVGRGSHAFGRGGRSRSLVAKRLQEQFGGKRLAVKQLE